MGDDPGEPRRACVRHVAARRYIFHHFFELACRAQVGALAGGTPLNIPAASVCEERFKKFGRMGQYDVKSRDWGASMELVEQNYLYYKE